MEINDRRSFMFSLRKTVNTHTITVHEMRKTACWFGTITASLIEKRPYAECAVTVLHLYALCIVLALTRYRKNADSRCPFSAKWEWTGLILSDVRNIMVSSKSNHYHSYNGICLNFLNYQSFIKIYAFSF